MASRFYNKSSSSSREAGTLRVTRDNGGGTSSLLSQFKPQQIGCFSRDKDDIFKPDESKLRYYCAPEDPDDLLWDLKANNEAYVEMDRSKHEIDRILKWMKHQQLQSNKEEDPSEDIVAAVSRMKLEPDIICRRGMLTRLIVSPYYPIKNSEPWKVAAIKYSGDIYLCEMEKVESDWGTPEEMRLSTITGKNFEAFVTSYTKGAEPDAETPVDDRDGFYLVMKAKLGKHSLIYFGEVDCCEEKGPSQERKYIQLHTSKLLDEPPKFFQALKLLKWWSSCMLVGVYRVVCGIKDHDAIVYHLKTYNTKDIPVICKDKWNPSTGFNFLDSLFTFMKDKLKDKPDDSRIAYVFSRETGATDVTYTEMEPDSEYCFLPEWYLEQKKL